MLKKSLLVSALLLCLVNLTAQQENNTTLGIETGLVGLFDSDRLGLFLHVEPRHKLSENIVLGLRVGVTINTHRIENNDIFRFNIESAGDNGVVSFVPTLEYRFVAGKLNPYAGIGIGYYILGNYLDVSRLDVATSPENQFEVNPKNKAGIMVRGGVKPGRFRLGVEYNFTPRSAINIPNGEEPGAINMSYLGLSAGIVIGGGKRRQ